MCQVLAYMIFLISIIVFFFNFQLMKREELLWMDQWDGRVYLLRVICLKFRKIVRDSINGISEFLFVFTSLPCFWV